MISVSKTLKSIIKCPHCQTEFLVICQESKNKQLRTPDIICKKKYPKYTLL